MKKSETGFSLLMVLAVVLVIGVVGGVGWYVWHRPKLPAQSEPQSRANTPSAADYTDCETSVDKVRPVAGSTISQYEWTTIEHTKVVLPGWGVTLTLPANLVGKAVCRHSANGYEFSTRAVVEDTACVSYYRNQELRMEGVDIIRYLPTSPAEGQVSGATGTLQDYYATHKAANGSYFAVPDGGNKYYKVGSGFYAAFGDTAQVLSERRAARAAACKNEKPDFTQPFVDALATLKQQ